MRILLGAVDVGQVGRTDAPSPGVVRDVVAEPQLGIASEIGPEIEAGADLLDPVLGDEHIVQVQVPPAPIEVEPRRDEKSASTRAA